MNRFDRWIDRFHTAILAFLIGVFILITARDINWGLPGHWHPDEIVNMVSWVLDGQEKIDETNFDYPSLPKYIMLGIGKATDALGYPRDDFYLASRFVSVLLGSAVIGLAYKITRAAGGKATTALLASLFVFTSSELNLHAHFAHNDLYVTFFTTLAILLLLMYQKKTSRLLLYAAFFTIGLAASSKYTGGALVVAALSVYLIVENKRIFKDLLRTCETLVLSLGLSFGGFALGTPKSLLWMAFYFKRMIPALLHHSQYARTPDSVPGIIGGWPVMIQAWSMPVFIVFMAGLLYWLARMGGKIVKKQDKGSIIPPATLVISIVVLMLPIMVSYNLAARFFLPVLPPIACLAALTVSEAAAYLETRSKPLVMNAARVGIILLLAITMLRVVSTDLILHNDARHAASDFLTTLPAGTSIEYTLYPPNVDKTHFSRAHNYPLIFIKLPDQELPTSPYFKYNTGEAGIEQRKTDYLVVDNLTSDRFNDPYICELHQAECDFFTRLQAGQTNYHLLKEFSYRLPAYLPQISVVFVNPDIRIYERNK